MSEEGFWNKTKRTVKGFINGAIKAAPMTLLYSGAAFGISAALGHYAGPDMDFLRVAGNDTGKIVTRLMGSLVIGSTLSGGIAAYESYKNPEHTPHDEPTGQKKPPAGKSPSTELSMNNIMIPSTPHTRDTQRTRTT